MRLRNTEILENIVKMKIDQSPDGGLIKSVFNDFLEMINAAPVVEIQQEWTSVKDELPKRRREYLCICQFGEDPHWRFCNVLMFNPEKDGDNGCVKGPHFSDEGMDGMKVVYWMPLTKMPDLTEEEKEYGRKMEK